MLPGSHLLAAGLEPCLGELGPEWEGGRLQVRAACPVVLGLIPSCLKEKNKQLSSRVVAGWRCSVMDGMLPGHNRA